MDHITKWFKQSWPMVGVIATLACLQLWLITRPMTFVINSLFADDTFYYFQIARNIVTGLGSSLDGVHITNGYHPLWMLVVIPISKYFASPFPDFEPIRVALLLSVVLNVGTALLVFRILSRFSSNRSIRIFGLIVWCLNPFLLYQTINGLETSLALFLFSIFFLLALRIEEERPIGGYWLIGIVGGLMVLARIDYAFYIVALLIWLFMRRGRVNTWMPIASTAFWTGALIFPWLIWNYVTYGMMLTSAAGAGTLISRAAVEYFNGTGIWVFLSTIIKQSQYHLGTVLQKTGMFAIGSAFGGIFALLVLRGDIALKKSGVPVTFALFAGFIMLFVADASIRWTARDWYFVSFDLFFVIMIVTVLQNIRGSIPRANVLGCILTGLVLFSFVVTWSKDLRPDRARFLQGSQFFVASQWLNDHLPAGSAVGAFAPGVLSYFSNMRMVDIDGVVNNSAYAAMQQRSLWGYNEKNVAYLCVEDFELSNNFYNMLGIENPLDHLTLIAEIPGGGGMKLYKVNTD